MYFFPYQVMSAKRSSRFSNERQVRRISVQSAKYSSSNPDVYKDKDKPKPNDLPQTYSDDLYIINLLNGEGIISLQVLYRMRSDPRGRGFYSHRCPSEVA